MDILLKIVITFFAGMGAGLGTGFAGMSAAAVIGGAPDFMIMGLCVFFTLLWARIAAVLANKATPKTLNRATGVILVVLGVVILGFNIWG